MTSLLTIFLLGADGPWLEEDVRRAITGAEVAAQARARLRAHATEALEALQEMLLRPATRRRERAAQRAERLADLFPEALIRLVGDAAAKEARATAARLLAAYQGALAAAGDETTQLRLHERIAALAAMA
jgi:hypothetical protein